MSPAWPWEQPSPACRRARFGRKDICKAARGQVAERCSCHETASWLRRCLRVDMAFVASAWWNYSPVTTLQELHERQRLLSLLALQVRLDRPRLWHVVRRP